MIKSELKVREGGKHSRLNCHQQSNDGQTWQSLGRAWQAETHTHTTQSAQRTQRAEIGLEGSRHRKSEVS